MDNKNLKIDREFESLLNKIIILTLRDGSVIEGVLKDETKYNIVLGLSTIKTKTFEAKVDYIIVNKSVMAFVTTKPLYLKSFEKEVLEKNE